jgi:hypothetical protein
MMALSLSVHSALCSSRLFSPLTTLSQGSLLVLSFFLFHLLFVGGHTARIFQLSGGLNSKLPASFAVGRSPPFLSQKKLRTFGAFSKIGKERATAN